MPQLSLEETDITLPFEKNVDQQINKNKKKQMKFLSHRMYFGAAIVFFGLFFFYFVLNNITKSLNIIVIWMQ